MANMPIAYMPLVCLPILKNRMWNKLDREFKKNAIKQECPFCFYHTNGIAYSSFALSRVGVSF